MDLVASQGHKVSRASVNLMPTPNTMDFLPARTPEQKAANKGKGGYANVRETVVNDLLPTTNWGKFAPAIERWEAVIKREAPRPTEADGKDGAHRLSSRFTEWMMGLPDGWVTSVGLSRKDELKACGNGVVPQQAELALRFLLEGMPLPSEKQSQVKLPTPTASDVFTDSLKSSQQKEGSMHSVTLPQAIRMVTNATN
jgi:DNA (cytosine-5)-methyltransferase 1